MYAGESVNSGTMSGSAHIYADPDVYDLVAASPVIPDELSFQQQQQQQQLDPAHITIDAIVQRGITTLIKSSHAVLLSLYHNATTTKN